MCWYYNEKGSNASEGSRAPEDDVRFDDFVFLKG